MRETRDKVYGCLPIDLRSCQDAAIERPPYVRLPIADSPQVESARTGCRATDLIQGWNGVRRVTPAREETEMKNIVLAYDGSDPARRALERTAEVANGAAVTVISAVQIFPAMGRAAASIDEDEIAERKQQLKDAADYLRGKSIEPETVVARGVDVAGAILEEAREADADLIVVGSSGKNLAKRVVLGSVSSKVVHGSPCDVLVVR